MPFKTWAPFERLLSADMNTYVANQTVAVFANAAARDAAITAPVSGQLAWLTDARRLTAYDGATWRTVGFGGGLPTAVLYSTATQAISNSGNIPVTSLTAVGWDSHGFALGSSQLTIPAGLAGKYQILGDLQYASGGSANSLMAAILMVAGATYTRTDTTNTSNGGGVQVAALAQLAVGNVVALQARQTGAASTNLLANSRLALHWVGD